MSNNTVITKDMANKKLHVTRQFTAPVNKVWKAWTEADILDQWWAPKPWKAETKQMDFTEGGHWLYAMVGPNGEKHWSKVSFESIKPGVSFTATAIFSDENGNQLPNAPVLHWLNTFSAAGTGTKGEFVISFDNDTDIKTIIEMGFEGGFTMGLNNLEELLANE